MESGAPLAHGNPLTLTVRSMAAGQRVFGRFFLKRILGQGGMGVVWLAWDEKLGEEVALKFVPDLLRWNRKGLEEIRAETKRSRTLAHPNIVRVHDLLEEAGMAAIAMEYVSGGTLADFASSHRGTHLEVEDIAPWIGSVCSALDYAHQQARLVHRDLKPANLLRATDGTVKIADFGVARRWAEVAASLTHAGQGTCCYMSPQQQLGELPTPADDIYSLGATLYELLTGKPPFFSGNIAAQVLQCRPEPIAARRRALGVDGAPVPPMWEQTILACLDKEGHRRPASGADLAARLVVRTVPDPGLQLVVRRWLLPGLAAVAVVASGLALWHLLARGQRTVSGKSPAPAVARSLDKAGFSDDFFSNFSGWLAWGEPRPQRIQSFQGRKWLLDNNGDDMYLSGLTSLNRFDFPEGFTLETEVYLSVTNPAGCHCEAYVGLTRNPARWMNALGSEGDAGEGLVTGLNFAGDACWGTPLEGRRHLWWGGSFLSEEGKQVVSGEQMTQEAQFVDELANRWTRLRVEVDADRRVKFYADDRLMWAPDEKLHPAVLQGQRVVLKGRSLGSAGKAYHDWVRLTPAGEGAFAIADIAPTHSKVHDLGWSASDWQQDGGVDFPQASPGGQLELNTGEQASEISLRSRKRWKSGLAAVFQVQPFLRSASGGRDVARVGLVALGEGRRERFIGVELVADQIWLVDSGRAEGSRRVAMLGGYASGSWQTLIIQVDAKGRFSVTGSFMEAFPLELGEEFKGQWAVEVAVRESGDGARFQPVRIGAQSAEH